MLNTNWNTNWKAKLKTILKKKSYFDPRIIYIET